MSTLKYTNLADIYSGFKAIPDRDFSKKIYYFEKNVDDILHMHEFYRIELTFQYVSALFEIGHYRKCLNQIELLLLDLFEAQTIDNEKEILCDLLIRKSCSLFNLDQFEDAEHVTKELLKINPAHSRSARILQSIKLRMLRKKFLRWRSLSIVFLFLGLCITIFDLLVIQNFYPDRAFEVMVFRNSILGLASFVLLGLEWTAFWTSKRQTRQFQAAVQAKKTLHL